MMEKIDTPLKDCFLLKPEVFEDSRGIFMETYSSRRFREITGLDIDFVQDNQSVSSRGVLRGFHFQRGEHAQAKLVRCPLGEILDVVVDLRPDSPTFKMSYKVRLSDSNHLQLFVPAGFAHGFVTLSTQSIFAYKCDQYYHRESEAGIRYNDPELNIDWELDTSELLLSKKDQDLPFLKDLQ